MLIIQGLLEFSTGLTGKFKYMKHNQKSNETDVDGIRCNILQNLFVKFHKIKKSKCCYSILKSAELILKCKNEKGNLTL